MRKPLPVNRPLLFALLMATGGSSEAYESKCYPDYVILGGVSIPITPSATRSGAPCSPGPESATNRWLGRDDEHRQILSEAMRLAGLPDFGSTVRLRTFTSAAGLPGYLGRSSVSPVEFRATARVRVREFAIAEMAQLPDFSISLSDWAVGNESCPFGPGIGLGECHALTDYLGALNSTHFVPQAQAMYRHLHELALSRSRTCATMSGLLGGDAQRFTEYLRACEVEALTIEATAQHFLHDAWSMGHMWQRWGGPEMADFGTPVELRYPRSLAVAAVSGIIHGARGVLQPDETWLRSINSSWTLIDVNDAMCAPWVTVQYRSAFPSAAGTYQGLGDNYLSQLLPTAEAPFHHQYRALMSCSVSGLLDVYEAGPRHHGVARPQLPSGVMRLNPTSDLCFGQRATNRAMAAGLGIDYRLAGAQQTRLAIDSATASTIVATRSAWNGSGVRNLPTNWDRLNTELADELSRLAFVFSTVADVDPMGTSLADNPSTSAQSNPSASVGSFLGIPRNGSFANRVPLNSYLDPALPWPSTGSVAPGAPERASALARIFHRAHAEDWCRRLDSSALDALRAHASASGSDTSEHQAACEACVEFSYRDTRVFAPDGTLTLRPLCDSLLTRTTANEIRADGFRHPLSTIARRCGCGLDLDPSWDLGHGDPCSDSLSSRFRQAQLAGRPAPALGSTDVDSFRRAYFGQYDRIGRLQKVVNVATWAPVPYDNGGSALVHTWNGVLIQDLTESLACPPDPMRASAIVAPSRRNAEAHHIPKEIWPAYRCLAVYDRFGDEYRATGPVVLGAPTGPATITPSAPGTSSVQAEQTFEFGHIWYGPDRNDRMAIPYWHVSWPSLTQGQTIRSNCSGIRIADNPPPPSTCINECVPGAGLCVTQTTRVWCGVGWDDDPCFEFPRTGEAMSCGPNEVCLTSACEACGLPSLHCCPEGRCMVGTCSTEGRCVGDEDAGLGLVDASAMDAPRSEAGVPGVADVGVEAGLSSCGNHICERSLGEHCGTCSGDCPCPFGENCAADGICQCPDGMGDCDDVVVGCETNLRTSFINCGRCGHVCGPEGICFDGACGCPAGQIVCGGRCVNPQTDTSACGGCDRFCWYANAAAVCRAGRCELGACAVGFTNCDGSSSNGCEARLASDQNNCGMCGVRCGRLNATSACADGRCSHTCRAGAGDCDGVDENGCETDLISSAAHCGRCGRACASGERCETGECRNPSTVDAGGSDVPQDTPLDESTPMPCAHQCSTVGEWGCERDDAVQTCSPPDAMFDCRHWGASTACPVGYICQPGLPGPTTGCSPCGAVGQACCASGRCNDVLRSCVASTGRCTSCPAGTRDCDRLGANSCEVNTDTDSSNCGACGHACGVGESCVAGVCRLMCPAEAPTNCSGTCVDTVTDPRNCGACGRVCALNNAVSGCDASICSVVGCSVGFANCDVVAGNGCEIELARSVAHCGRCGNACTYPNAAASCSGGACAMGACNVGFFDCNRDPSDGCESSVACVCTAGQTEPCYAGAAGTAGIGACRRGVRSCITVGGFAAWGACVGEVLPVAETCDNADNDCDGAADEGVRRPCYEGPAGTVGVGVCRAGAQTCGAGVWGACELGVGPGAEVCDGNDNDCDGMSDEGCACTLGATRACYGGPAGTAAIGTCRAGTQRCEVDGLGGATWGACEGEVRPVPERCDGLDNDCDGTDDGAPAHAACPVRTNMTTRCVGGACTYSCAPRFGDCDGNATNGCEASLDTDLAHCGRCGGACIPAVGGSALCAGGVCRQACPGTQTNCSGVCRATLDDVGNCGVCGRECAFLNATATCAAGVCTLGTCGTGYASCDGDPSNGCETDTRTTALHCGRCGSACTVANGTAACAAGTCAVAACYPGFADCDGLVGNGCESDIRVSSSHCGGCATPCTRVHGSATCSMGACSLTSCDAGFGNCDGVGSNGCEVALNGSVTHCGRCGNFCTFPHANATCTSGSCSMGACASGYFDCNQDAGDGCESTVACVCSPGTSEPCYGGPPGTAGVGACRAGTRTCTVTAGVTAWGACAGEARPTTETCDGLDNDCNGMMDDIAAAACALGACSTAALRCPATSPGVAVSAACFRVAYLPAGATCRAAVAGVGGVASCDLPETCSGDSDNCPPDAFAAVGAICRVAAAAMPPASSCDVAERCTGTSPLCPGDAFAMSGAVCRPSATNVSCDPAEVCTGGSPICPADVVVRTPVAEICNGIDDDCDGLVDSGVAPRACYTGPSGTGGVGLCRAGTQSCPVGGAGVWGPCAGEVLPSAEVCDNQDNNCDGRLDEGVSGPCYSGPSGTADVGMCRSGTRTCTAGNWGACSGQVTPSSEICANRVDDNCNGFVDDSPCGATGSLSVRLDSAFPSPCRTGNIIRIFGPGGSQYDSPPGEQFGPMAITPDWRGFSAITVVCRDTGSDIYYTGWNPLGRPARDGHVASILLNGVELSTGASLICNDPLGPGVKPLIPFDSAFAGSCPYGVNITCDVSSRPGWSVTAVDWISSYMTGPVLNDSSSDQDGSPSVFRLIVAQPPGAFFRGTFRLTDDLGRRRRAFEDYRAPLCTTTLRFGTTYSWPTGLPVISSPQFVSDSFVAASCPQGAILAATPSSSPPAVCGL